MATRAFVPGPKQRIWPKVTVKDISPHQSARTTPVLAAVVHATVSHNISGDADLKAIGSVFHSREASAHICTDADGHTARYVPDSRKAWACVLFNSPTVNTEQIAMATESMAEWKRMDKMLHETARNLAKWSRKYGFPLRRGAVSGATITRTGVLSHQQLGAAGGGHSDPGPGYPWGYVLWLARGYRRAQKRALARR